MFMFIPYVYLDAQAAGTGTNIDMTRVAAGVITGIGFLGAGVIFRRGVDVKGLTTAATIWVASGVGLLVGIGLYIIATISTVVIILVLHTFHYLAEEYLLYQELEFLNIQMYDKPKVKKDIEWVLSRLKIQLDLSNFEREDDKIRILYKIQMPRVLKKQTVANTLLKNPNVISLKWRE
jgi:putative Mg2+ transporter-C (MgtC) family protein